MSPQEESEHHGGLVLRPAGTPRPPPLGLSPGLEVTGVSTLPGCKLAVTGREEAPLVQEETSTERRGQVLPQQQVS